MKAHVQKILEILSSIPDSEIIYMSDKLTIYEYKNVTIKSYGEESFAKLRSIHKLDLSKLSCNFYYNPHIKGASSSLIFYTADFEFAIKLINRNELNTLKMIVDNYCDYLYENRSSYLVKIVGCYEIEFKDKRSNICKDTINCKRDPELIEYNVIIMKNIFQTLLVKNIYDIKGYSLDRKFSTLIKKENEWVLSDNRIYVDNTNDITFQIYYDTMFLMKNNIMDYSLIISENTNLKNELFEYNNIDKSDTTGVNVKDYITTDKWSYGIIDILTSYNCKKKVENLFYYVCLCNRNKSCKSVIAYHNRFMKMVKEFVFKDIDDVYEY